ncbi:EthD domain-containing protein [Niveibacterium terrae]|uniref:EthD domain-containing protein n=1 Tax=Niveibacterium terrae TaxID=3373598 RepID=UPI003A95ADB9
MFKLITCVRRLPSLSAEEFDMHWRERHAPLIQAQSHALKIRRYIQNAPLADPALQEAIRAGRDAEPADFDGCAELWWDSREDFLAARTTPEGVRALALVLEDEHRFVDLERSKLWFVAERAVL